MSAFGKAKPFFRRADIVAGERHGFLIHSGMTGMFQVMLQGEEDTE